MKIPYLLILTVVTLGLLCEVSYSADQSSIFSIDPDDVQKAKEILTADPSAANARGENGITPLHRLAALTSLSLNIQHGLQGTFTQSSESKVSSVAILLISKGADVNAKDNQGGTPLHLAISNKNTGLAKLLIENGADVNATLDKVPGWEGTAPLTLAAGHGDVEIMTLLISKGADVNKSNKKGWTPLHQAAVYGHLLAAQLLLKNKARVDARDATGKTPLAVAIEAKEKEIASLLRRHGGK